MRLSLGSTAYGAKPLDVEDDRTPPVARAVFTAGSRSERFFLSCGNRTRKGGDFPNG